MFYQRKLYYVAAYVLAGAVAVMTVSAEETTSNQSSQSASAPQGNPEQISDWGLAAIAWSDASLAHKVAAEALKANPDSQQREQLQTIASETRKVIDQLEAFGWKQSPAPSAKSSSTSRGSSSASGSDPTSKAKQRSSIKVFDTETPAGANDPGVDDELIQPEAVIDIEQYRVDDYIDETPQEARNRSDALEDGTEAAIAAAAGRRTIRGRVAGRISEREVMTRSSTMAYSQDSIYDRDDYDPDIDYQIDNPAGTRFTNPESIDRGDGDDDIDPGFEPVIDGEDELLANQIRRQKRRGSVTQMDRYTSDSNRHQQDADWVQLHLDTNQLLWQHLSARNDLTESAMDALRRLKASSMLVGRTTQNEKLRSMLKPIQELQLQ